MASNEVIVQLKTEEVEESFVTASFVNLIDEVTDEFGQLWNQCTLCCSRFKERRRLHNHLKRVHDLCTELEAGEKSYKCIHCDKTFSKQTNMYRHIRQCHKLDPHGDSSAPPKLFICDICGREFSTNINHSKHMRQVHNMILSSGSSSEVKDQDDSSQDNAVNESVSQKEDCYRCTMCPAAFNRRANALRHIKQKHNIPTDQAVLELEQTFTSESEEEEESDEANRCDACDEEFADVQSWSEHMKSVHNVDPDICCPYCGAHTFHTMYDRQVHIQTIHQIYPREPSDPAVINTDFGLNPSELAAIDSLPDWLLKRCKGHLSVVLHRDL